MWIKAPHLRPTQPPGLSASRRLAVVAAGLWNTRGLTMAQDPRPDTYRALLQRGRWFASLPAAHRDALLTHAVLRRLPAGAMLFRRGDDNAGLYCVLEGAVRIARRLLALSQGHGMLAEGLAHRTVPVNQEQLGAMLSLSRQTVSEVLRDFEARGWVRRHYRAVELLDWQALAQAVTNGRAGPSEG